jgi:hypothetical protein
VERESGGLSQDIIPASEGRARGKENILDGLRTAIRNHDKEAKSVTLRFLGVISSFIDAVWTTEILQHRLQQDDHELEYKDLEGGSFRALSESGLKRGELRVSSVRPAGHYAKRIVGK